MVDDSSPPQSPQRTAQFIAACLPGQTRRSTQGVIRVVAATYGTGDAWPIRVRATLVAPGWEAPRTWETEFGPGDACGGSPEADAVTLAEDFLTLVEEDLSVGPPTSGVREVE
jgi:hypothetical protein